MNPGSYLLCIGLTTVDVVALPVRTQPFEGVRLIKALQIAPAGTAAGAALVAARLKVPTQLAGAIGRDALGRFVRAELTHAGVDVSLLQSIDELPTSSTLIPIDECGARMIYHAPGAAAHMDLTEPLKLAAAHARSVHYAAVGARNFAAAADLLAVARRGGALISCDLIAPGPDAAQELRHLLPHVDVFMPSAIEARFLTGEHDLARAAHAFKSWGAGACVIKNGADGVIALARDGALTQLPAVPVAHIVDTTSCGDSFCAGFIAATMRSRSWPEALQFAAATAALVAQGPATLGALQSFEQAEALRAASYNA